MITREYLETKIQELTAARDKLQGDVYANNGAIQFCQHLLATSAVESESDAKTHEAAEESESAKANGEALGP